MSNKIVPGVYRSIITEVVDSLQADFDEFGINEEVLGTLKQKWEARVLASRAADFNGSEVPNPHSAQYNGVGSVALNNSYNPSNSPQLNRTQSPANAGNNRSGSRTNTSFSSNGTSNSGTSGAGPSNNSNSHNGNVQVKTEPVDNRYVGRPPNASMPGPPYPYSMMQGLPPHLSNVPPPLPNLTSQFGPLPSIDPYNRTHPGYGPGAAGGAASRDILMLPRGAAPYNAGAAAAVGGGGNAGGNASKIPQVDGSWSSEEFSNASNASRRQWLNKRYPWMAQAQLRSVDQALGVQLPQVDGPSSGTPPPIPALNLPPINPHPPSGIQRANGPGSITLPPLNLPPSGGNGSGVANVPPPLRLGGVGGGGGDIPPLKIETPPPGGAKSIHPSLVNHNLGNEIKRSGSTPPNPAGPSSAFARNPNVPALASEDINSDLDDSDEEDGPQEQPGQDPDADVTYCTYDKVTRVKTKWKVVFRDGMVHANGKDYLFGRCTGEFDW